MHKITQFYGKAGCHRAVQLIYGGFPKVDINAGMNEHVAKPIDVDILKKTLAKFL